LNRVDEKTRRMVRGYFETTEDDREWGLHQPEIKENHLKKVHELNPDWIIAIDADETFDCRFTRSEAENLIRKGGIGYYFYVVNLYNEGYSKEWSFWNVRFWKAGYTGYENKPLHCGLAPKIVYEYANYAPFILKHYGLKEKKDREAKVKRYQRYDPAASHKGKAYYDFLASDTQAEPFDEREVHTKVAEEVKDYSHKDKKIDMPQGKKFFYVKNPHGQIIDIPEIHLEETLKRPGFELISKIPIILGGDEFVKTTITESLCDDTKDMTCKECGFIAQSPFGLRSHKRKHVRA